NWNRYYWWQTGKSCFFVADRPGQRTLFAQQCSEPKHKIRDTVFYCTQQNSDMQCQSCLKDHCTLFDWKPAPPPTQQPAATPTSSPAPSTTPAVQTPAPNASGSNTTQSAQPNSAANASAEAPLQDKEILQCMVGGEWGGILRDRYPVPA